MTLVIGLQIPGTLGGDVQQQIEWLENDLDLGDYLALIQPYYRRRSRGNRGLPPLFGAKRIHPL